jgi:glycosyltransferase involved in cell wall biosynthesis
MIAAVAHRAPRRPVPPAAPIDVVCLPDMEWDHRVWTNRQHVMYRLPSIAAAARVLYVSPPRWILSGRLAARARLRRPALPERPVRDGPWTKRVGERLWVLQPPLPVPSRLARRLAPRLLDAWTLALTRRTMRRLGFARPCLWTYTPLAARLLGRLRERLVVYDVVDHYPALPAYANAPKVAALDAALTEAADLVFVTSRTLYDERRDRAARCRLVGNAADIEHFARARGGNLALPPALDAVPQPLIGFHGSLSGYKLDLALLRELAVRRPEWSLVLVGPETDPQARRALAGFANVHLLGPVSHADLPAFLARFSVCLIPYKRTAYTERLNALKVYECLAAGRPVVASDLPCFRELAPWVRVASGAEGFERAVAGLLDEGAPPCPLDELDRFAWPAKVRRMWAEVEDALAVGGR